MPAPAPEPQPQPPTVRPLPRSVAPQPILEERFDDTRIAARWRIGVLATPPETFDATIAVAQSDGLLTITPPAKESGSHFSGYVSTDAFDLTGMTIAVDIRRAAPDATTIFAAAADDANWAGFRIEGGQLVIESHSHGRVAAKKLPYSASEHRHLRVRTSSVAPVVVWETSSDGTSWTPHYVETSTISLSALHIALAAGTNKPRMRSGSTAFAGVSVEAKQ